MSRRITITLTDEEYAALEQRAAQDRRSPREMAAYLVTQPAWAYYIRPYPYTVSPQQPWQWWQQPTFSTSGTLTIVSCQACSNPSTSAEHTCLRIWNSTTSQAG